MPGHIHANVRSTDDLAEYFKRISQRLASLERANSSGSGGGGGGGTDEVWIGPTDPIPPNNTIELWYDTDAAGYTTDDLRWLSGWGVIAKGTFNPEGSVSLSAGFSRYGITNPLTTTLTVGRRYKVEMHIRAFGPVAGGGNRAMFNCYLNLDGTSRDVGTDVWMQTHGNWGNGIAQWSIDCVDGGSAGFQVSPGSHTFQVLITDRNAIDTRIWTDTVTTTSGFFTITDVGPINSMAVPASPTTVTAWALTPLGTGWQGYPGWQAPRYRRIGDIVYMEGLAQTTTARTAGSAHSLGTLPVGYRPLSNQLTVAVAGDPITTARVDIGSNGNLGFWTPSTGLDINDYVSLSNIQWAVT